MSYIDSKECELPAWAQTVIYSIREELHLANKALAVRNAELRALRSELRLMRRVMRLKNEELVRSDSQPPTVRSVGTGMGDL